MVLLGIWVDLGALLIALFTIFAAFLIHHFWTDQDPMSGQIEMTQIMKDVALTGGALILFVLYSVLGDDLGYQIVAPLFDLSL